MDFAALDTKTPAEKGAFLHLKHPALGHPLWEGEGKDRVAVGVFVRGTESKTVQDLVKEVQKTRLKNGGDDDGEGLTFVTSLVISFQGVERGGKPITASEEDTRWFFGLSDDFVEQVINFAKNRASFFKSALTA